MSKNKSSSNRCTNMIISNSNNKMRGSHNNINTSDSDGVYGRKMNRSDINGMSKTLEFGERELLNYNMISKEINI